MSQLDTRLNRSANATRDRALQKQLQTRQQRLQAALASPARSDLLADLLKEVDAALERLQAGTFGICETCHENIESERLLVDPLARNCLDHLSPAEQRALERDLDLACQVQNGLLPRAGLVVPGWSWAYHYEPHGAVSGDYCDLIPRGNDGAFFCIGDVTGKGVAASMLMAQLYAIFRSLAAGTTSPHGLLTSANRIFCEGTLTSYFATVACGRLGDGGEIEIANAGHCYPLHLHAGASTPIPSTGLPLGLFCETDYGTQKLTLRKGDSLVLYTDGLTEAFNSSRAPYGAARLTELLQKRGALQPKELLAVLLDDLRGFTAGARRTDDLTIMILQRDD